MTSRKIEPISLVTPSRRVLFLVVQQQWPTLHQNVLREVESGVFQYSQGNTDTYRQLFAECLDVVQNVNDPLTAQEILVQAHAVPKEPEVELKKGHGHCKYCFSDYGVSKHDVQRRGADEPAASRVTCLNPYCTHEPYFEGDY